MSRDGLADTTDVQALWAALAELKAQVRQMGERGGNGGYGPEFGLPMIPLPDQRAFHWDGKRFTNCYFQFGREVYYMPDVQASEDGTYFLKVPHDSPLTSAAIIRGDDSDSTDMMQTVIPLIRVYNGEVIQDFRGMPVIPVRE